MGAPEGLMDSGELCQSMLTDAGLLFFVGNLRLSKNKSCTVQHFSWKYYRHAIVITNNKVTNNATGEVVPFCLQDYKTTTDLYFIVFGVR